MKREICFMLSLKLLTPNSQVRWEGLAERVVSVADEENDAWGVETLPGFDDADQVRSQWSALPTSKPPQLIVLHASKSADKTGLNLRDIRSLYPLVPVIIATKSNRADLDDILALPADDFHDFDSGHAMLHQRMRRCMAREVQPSRNLTAALKLAEDEADVWRTLFHNAGAGMLTGRSHQFLRAKAKILAANNTKSSEELVPLIRQCLHAIQWELNNEKAYTLLQLQHPVVLSSEFVDRIVPLDAKTTAAEFNELGMVKDSILGEFSIEANGTSTHLSIEFNTPSNLTDVILVTLQDITERVTFEQRLREHVDLLEARVIERTHAISIVNNKLEEESQQRKRLAEQVRKNLVHITGGVISAKRILDVALPGKAEMASIFPNSILVERPRDIMGGDFLFTAEKNQRRTLALIDSTGHGIPGAMVSLMGSTLINRAFVALPQPDPSSILQHFHRDFGERMKVNPGHLHMYGFDAGIITIDDKAGVLEFAGARGDLFLVRNGETQIFRGTRGSIEIQEHSMRHAGEVAFAQHIVPFEPGDQFYMATDGVRDQFGGELNRKLGRKRLADILAAKSALQRNEREKAIQQTLLIWKGANAKVDDATLVGIEI